jgi:hypothetical protein
MEARLATNQVVLKEHLETGRRMLDALLGTNTEEGSLAPSDGFEMITADSTTMTQFRDVEATCRGAQDKQGEVLDA